jgi:Flp pilus assembly protein TadG
MRLSARPRGNETGQGLVEFALAAPIVFLVLIGLFDVGRLVFINNEMAEAAREGARWGVVQGRAADEVTGANSAVSDTVRDRIVVTPAPVVEVRCVQLTALSGTCRSGDLLTVEVTSSVRAITPIISDIIGPLDLVSDAQMTIH